MSVELRVHGIGNHKAVDGLGSPRVDPTSGTSPGRLQAVDMYSPPARPTCHDLTLGVWSRTSRQQARFFWYLALPYTLINTTGYMSPGAPSRRRTFHALVVTSGLLLTVAAATWAFASVETLVSGLPWQTGPWATRLGIGVVTGVVVVSIVRRARTRMSGLVPTVVAAAHIVVLGAYAGVLIGLRPAARRVPDGAWWPLPTSCTTPNCGTATRYDLVSTIALVTAAAAAVLSLALYLLGRERGVGGRRAAAGSGAALATAAAFLLVHLVGAFGRFGLAALLKYLRSFAFWRALAPEQPTAPNVDLPQLVLPATDRVLLVVNPGGQRLFLPDTVALFCLLVLFVFAVASSCAWLAGGVRDAPRLLRRGLRSHAFTVGLPHVLPRILLVTGLVAGGLGWGLSVVVRASNPSRGASGWLLPLQAGGALVLLFLVLGYASPAVRSVFGKVADVLGFWPVRWHPLAGRSYREDVTDCLQEKVAEQVARGDVALVGHSQGSVLCAWLVGRPDVPARARRDWRSRLHLVTCGSPLDSLYAAFFPSHFDEAFFRRARCRVASWDNFWRSTDPIATHLSARPEGAASAHPRENAEPTERCAPGEADVIRNVEIVEADPAVCWGHSNYWTDDRMMSRVSFRLADPRQPVDGVVHTGNGVHDVGPGRAGQGRTGVEFVPDGAAPVSR